MSKRQQSWYSMKATNEVAEVLIYDDIGMWGITAADFSKDLRTLQGRDINLRLNTSGGSVFEGMAIYNTIDQYKGRVTTHVDGLAASIGSIVALAGDELRMAANSFIMIHEPWAMTMADAKGHRKAADTLEKISDTALDIYESRTSLERGELAEMMQEETWFNADAAVSAGFADSISGESEAQAHFDLSKYHNVPELLRETPEAPDNIRDYEALVRRMGFAKTEARDIALHGFNNSGRREADARRREAGIRELTDRIRRTT